MLGLDVPVHAGASRPLLAPARYAPQVHGETGLDGPVLPSLERELVDSDDALGFLLDATRREEGLWLVATGPLTNVALALRADPGIRRPPGRDHAHGRQRDDRQRHARSPSSTSGATRRRLPSCSTRRVRCGCRAST